MSDQAQPDGVAESPAAGTAPSRPAETSVTVADGVERPVDPRVVWVWRMGHAVFAGFVSMGALIAMAIIVLRWDGAPWVRLALPAAWLAFVVAVGCWAFFWPALRYRHLAYRIFPDAVEIRRGVVFRTVVHVPKSRVQHTDVSRGPIERAFGLATLVIYTAGTEHASISLGGLPEATAFAARDHLIPGDGDDAV